MADTVKHTPGPWLNAGRSAGAHIHSDNGEVAWLRSYVGISSDEIDANARLISAAPEMLEVLHEGRRAIGEHLAPNDCYATGPLTGNDYRDLIECPACSFIGKYEAVLVKVGA